MQVVYASHSPLKTNVALLECEDILHNLYELCFGGLDTPFEVP